MPFFLSCQVLCSGPISFYFNACCICRLFVGVKKIKLYSKRPSQLNIRDQDINVILVICFSPLYISIETMVKVKLYSLFMNQEIRDLLLISAPFQLILKQPFNRNNRKYSFHHPSQTIQCPSVMHYANIKTSFFQEFKNYLSTICHG